MGALLREESLVYVECCFVHWGGLYLVTKNNKQQQSFSLSSSCCFGKKEEEKQQEEAKEGGLFFPAYFSVASSPFLLSVFFTSSSSHSSLTEEEANHFLLSTSRKALLPCVGLGGKDYFPQGIFSGHGTNLICKLAYERIHKSWRSKNVFLWAVEQRNNKDGQLGHKALVWWLGIAWYRGRWEKGRGRKGRTN